MKRIGFILLAILMTGATFTGFARAGEEPAAPAPAAETATATSPAKQEATVVATVNGAPIAADELAMTVNQMQRFRQYQEHTTATVLPPVTEEQLKQEALESLIFLELAYQAGQKSVTVEPAEIDAKIEEVKAKYPDDETFQAELQKRDITEAQLRDKVARQLIITEIIKKEVEDKAVVDEAAARQQMAAEPERFTMPARIVADALFVPIKLGAHKQAEDLVAELREKKSVDLLADTEGVRVSRKVTVSAETDEKIFAELEGLQPGEVSEVVIVDKTGMHVFQILERTSAEVISYEQAQPWFLEQAKAALGRAWSEKLRQEAKVEILLESAKPAEPVAEAPASPAAAEAPEAAKADAGKAGK